VWFNTPRFLSESYKCNLLMAGLLTYSLFAGLPVPIAIGIVAVQGQKVWCGAYSSGNCSGFSPDSLLACYTKNHKPDANVKDRIFISKIYNKILNKSF